MEVYKLARKLAKEVFEESKKFPKEEMYSLTVQVRRASRQHWLETALDCEYLIKEVAANLLQQCEIIGKMLNSMMSKSKSFCTLIPKTKKNISK